MYKQLSIFQLKAFIFQYKNNYIIKLEEKNY
jgi:hypothetical protein